jgi:hypothetical protein
MARCLMQLLHATREIGRDVPEPSAIKCFRTVIREVA